MGPFRRDDLRDSANATKKNYAAAQGESVSQQLRPRKFLSDVGGPKHLRDAYFEVGAIDPEGQSDSTVFAVLPDERPASIIVSKNKLAS
jgi:hypothetical protein